MSFVHCHRCGWEQDDFWDEQYNPLRSEVKSYEHALLHDDLERVLGGMDNEPAVTLREVIARSLERSAAAVRGMKWRTKNEFKVSNPKRKCPQCGGQLDED